jgi:transcriptional regulator with XRE-family HTH domain
MENNTTTAEQLGKEIALVRLKRGLRQADLGRLTQATQAHISAIEKGDQNLTLSSIDKIASLLNCRVDIKLRKLKTKKAE